MLTWLAYIVIQRKLGAMSRRWIIIKAFKNCSMISQIIRFLGQYARTSNPV